MSKCIANHYVTRFITSAHAYYTHVRWRPRLYRRIVNHSVARLDADTRYHQFESMCWKKGRSPFLCLSTRSIKTAFTQMSKFFFFLQILKRPDELYRRITHNALLVNSMIAISRTTVSRGEARSCRHANSLHSAGTWCSFERGQGADRARVDSPAPSLPSLSLSYHRSLHPR